VNVADFGCSEGRNALLSMNYIVDKVRKQTDRPIQVFFNDLPTNDWTVFFKTLEDSPDVYHKRLRYF
jgi:gibberellin A4 carboxyl methyltransferase